MPQGGVVRSNLYADSQGRIRCRPKSHATARLKLTLISSIRKTHKWLQKATGFRTNAVHPERNVNPFVVESEE